MEVKYGKPLRCIGGRKMDQGWLRSKAREAIRSGKLPHRLPDQTWAGPGSDRDCTVCGKVLAHEESELELSFGTDVMQPGPVTFRMHLRCFDAWELELPQAENGTPDGFDDKLPPAKNVGTMTHLEHTGTNERENR